MVGRLHGKPFGASIAGIQVNEMLGAFTDTKDVLFGLLELKRYDLEFRGSSAEEIQRSLTGSWRLELSDGRMALLDARLRPVVQHFNIDPQGRWTSRRRIHQLRPNIRDRFRPGE